MSQDRYLFEGTVVLLHLIPIARYLLGRRRGRVVACCDCAVDQRHVSVVAHASHLAGQKVGEGGAICCTIVIAVLFVLADRNRHLLSNVCVDVILREDWDCPINHAVPGRGIKLRIFGEWGSGLRSGQGLAGSSLQLWFDRSASDFVAVGLSGLGLRRN